VLTVARIRTIKPEAFTSESLASVSLTAERTFFGLLTQADDQGRHRDHAAIIAGLLWPLRPEHTPLDVEEDLAQLAAARLICRYTGEDGKGYLHILSWHRHQKINRASASRLPACPHHESAGARADTRLSEPSPRSHGGGAEEPMSLQGGAAGPSPSWHRVDEPGGQRGLHEASVNDQGGHTEPSVRDQSPDLGSGTVDQQSVPAGRAAPAPPASARQLVAEYAAACANRPPGKVLGHLGREISHLLAEGIGPDHIRAGLERFRARPMHPSVLPSLVNEAMNGGRPGRLARPGSVPTVQAHRPWTNPADSAAYAEEL
jgi:hypothetical protein